MKSLCFLRSSCNLSIVRFVQAEGKKFFFLNCTATSSKLSKWEVSKQKEFIEDLAKKLNITHPSDWYKANIEKSKEIPQIDGEFHKALEITYPSFEFHPWKFQKVPKNFWTQIKNQKRFFEWIANELNIKDDEDWYKVKLQDIEDRGGIGLLTYHFNGSLAKALQFCFPDKKFLPWKFESAQKNLWAEFQTQKSFIEYISPILSIEKPEDWYKVKYIDFEKHGGRALLSHFKGSLFALLVNIHPSYEKKLLPWLFQIQPNDIWQNTNIQQKFIEWIEKELTITSMEQWYDIKKYDIEERGGKSLLEKYNGSIYELIKVVHSNYEWLPWKFNPVPRYWNFFMIYFPRNFWNQVSNQRKFLDWLKEKLQIKTQYQWNRVRDTEIERQGGRGFLELFSGNFAKGLNSAYPERLQYPWLQGKLSREFWKHLENQKNYLEWLMKEYRMENYKKLYNLTLTDFVNNGGEDLIAIYERDVYNLVNNVFGGVKGLVCGRDHLISSSEYFPWLGESPVNPSYWKNLQNQRSFFDWMAKDLNLSKQEDWYSIKFADVEKRGGRSLLDHYKASLSKALETAYPEQKWLPWQFEKVRTRFWDNSNNVEAFITWFSSEVGITKLEDWYNVSYEQIEQYGGYMVLRNNGGLFQVLSKLYPLHKWDFAKFESHTNWGKAQWLLQKLIQKLFPSVSEVKSNYHHPDLRYEGTGQKMELDIFIPSLNLAFEYQGSYHYEYHYLFGDPTFVKLRDAEKREACKKNGITLIEVPYWWDYKKESIVELIRESRSDLVNQIQI